MPVVGALNKLFGNDAGKKWSTKLASTHNGWSMGKRGENLCPVKAFCMNAAHERGLQSCSKALAGQMSMFEYMFSCVAWVPPLSIGNNGLGLRDTGENALDGSCVVNLFAHSMCCDGDKWCVVPLRHRWDSVAMADADGWDAHTIKRAFNTLTRISCMYVHGVVEAVVPVEVELEMLQSNGAHVDHVGPADG